MEASRVIPEGVSNNVIDMVSRCPSTPEQRTENARHRIANPELSRDELIEINLQSIDDGPRIIFLHEQEDK